MTIISLFRVFETSSTENRRKDILFPSLDMAFDELPGFLCIFPTDGIKELIMFQNDFLRPACVQSFDAMAEENPLIDFPKITRQIRIFGHLNVTGMKFLVEGEPSPAHLIEDSLFVERFLPPQHFQFPNIELSNGLLDGAQFYDFPDLVKSIPILAGDLMDGVPLMGNEIQKSFVGQNTQGGVYR